MMKTLDFLTYLAIVNPDRAIGPHLSPSERSNFD